MPDENLSGQLNLAWKTGTSYGYRDAWAIGVNPRYTIGVWVGRPDATPVAGQLGFATAIPIMNQVNAMLLVKYIHPINRCQKILNPPVSAKL